MEKIVKKLVNNRAIVLFFMVIVAFYGCFSYYVIPKQENPNTTVPIAIITTVYPGATPEDVENLVTSKIEEELKTLDTVDYFTSMSMNSASAVVVMFDMEYNIEEVETELRHKIERLQPSLPDMCQESMINTDVVTKNQFIISLSSDVYDSAELAEYAKTIKEELEKVKGLASVTIDGLSRRQVVVDCDIDKLRMYGTSIENVLGLMQAQNLSIPAGSINYNSGSINVNSSAIFESLKDIENVVAGGAEDHLGFIKVKDLADVYIENVSDYYYKQDGKDAILLTGVFEEGINAVNIGKNVRKTLDRIKADVPPEIDFHEVMYAPQDISDSINSFILNLIESVALIVIVVMIGVKLTNGLIISVALPMSILITFIVMKHLNIEFQFISIAALIVSLGILVDNAIVVSEEIQRYLNKGMDKMKAVTTAVKTTAMPVFTSTLTTVVTFSIIYFVPGTVGQVARTIPTVVIASLAASYIIAMFTVPVMGYMFFKPEAGGKKEKLGSIKKFFDSALNFGMNHKKRTIAGAFGTLFIVVFLVSQLGLQFFPTSAKPVIYINVTGETLALEKTGEICDNIGSLLDEEELVDNYTYAVGQGLPTFFLTVPSTTPAANAGQFMLQLNKDELKKIGSTDKAARYIQEIIDRNIAGAKVEVKCLEYSMPVDAKITLTVTGNDINEINSVADEISNALNQIEGTDYVRDSSVIPQYQYKVKLDSELLSGYGLLKFDVVKQLNTSLMGATASSFVSSGNEMDIVVRANIDSLDKLYNMPIVGSAVDTKVTLGQIADIELETTVPIINHFNGKTYVNVMSNILPGYSSLKIEKELNDKYLANMDLSEVEILSRGEVKNMMDLLVDIFKSAAMAVVVIYVILLLQFKDFIKPFIILTSIPLSLIGCSLGLFALKMDLQVMAILGLVSLFGIVVNNGILLIEVIDAEIKEGKDVESACRSAVDQRFRPIMLSSTTTCIGLLPLIAAGDPMSAPMATVLMFGLLFSTVLTMVVVPVLYSMIFGKKQNKVQQ